MITALPINFFSLPLELSHTKPAEQFYGGDVTEIARVEKEGGRFFDHGKQEDPFKILKNHGWTAVRFRIWVNPVDGWCSESEVLGMARRAKKAGLKIMLDPHYSDTWADPQHQITPVAWQKLNYSGLKQKIYAYTFKLVKDFKNQGTPPSVVQIGNEITVGFCWPLGHVLPDDPSSWTRLAGLVNAGLKAVHDSEGKSHITTMIHIDRGGDFASSKKFVDHLLQDGCQFDILGLSYYPWWHGTLYDLQLNLTQLSADYRFKLMIAETAYPFESKSLHLGGFVFDGKQKLVPGYPATPQGQNNFLLKLKQICQPLPKFVGILYWAPTWIYIKDTKIQYGNGWRNLTLFDESGNALPGVTALRP